MKSAVKTGRLVSLLLFVSAVICLFLSIFLESGEASPFIRRIGLLLLAVLVLQTAFFRTTPESDNNK